MRTSRRLLIAAAATLAILLPLGWMWWSSLLPGSYSVMDMGYLDYGGGSKPAGVMEPGGDMHGMDHAGMTSVADLVADPDRTADVTVDLVARKATVTLASGREVSGYTINDQSPGPLIEATQGDLVEVHLTNESVPQGITLHWHGVDVPNAEDGVAGVTQDAVEEGEDFTYRFVADQVGTYWYHSHQVSHEQVKLGLLGPLVVNPVKPVPQDVDEVVLAHTYAGTRTLNGREDGVEVDAQPGDTVRLRIIDTDNNSFSVWASDPYRVLATDGYDVHRPGPVEDAFTVVGAGGRIDVEVTVPDDGSSVGVEVGGFGQVTVGATGAEPPDTSDSPPDKLDLMSYGEPDDIGFDATDPDRTFTYDIGRRPGFLDGKPGLWWTINGHLFPDVPMFVVEEGDVVVMDIDNNSGRTHPMHLHGHHAVVISHDGKPATGSPWWVDSLEVPSGEEYRIAFLADNPGIWMDHCHQLDHATQGLVAHLMYAGVDTPYRVGGDADNHPE